MHNILNHGFNAVKIVNDSHKEPHRKAEEHDRSGNLRGCGHLLGHDQMIKHLQRKHKQQHKHQHA